MYAQGVPTVFGRGAKVIEFEPCWGQAYVYIQNYIYIHNQVLMWMFEYLPYMFISHL